MILNYVYRIYPDAKQEESLNEWLDICRASYNYALRELKDWIASRKCAIDRCSLESEYIMSADYPWLKVLPKRLSKKQRCDPADASSAKERAPKRSANYEKARSKVEAMHNHIAWQRQYYQFKLAHKLCDMADTIFVEDCDFRIMAKGFLGKHTLNAAFGQFRQILKYVGKRRGVFVDEVDHRGTSQVCPNCRTEVRKELKDRYHICHECGYGVDGPVDRDVASAQEICNRGIEKHSTQGLWGKEIGYQVGLSGAFCLDKWRRVAMPSSDVGKPALYSQS